MKKVFSLVLVLFNHNKKPELSYVSNAEIAVMTSHDVEVSREDHEGGSPSKMEGRLSRTYHIIRRT
jgi:hypothetical protein